MVTIAMLSITIYFLINRAMARPCAYCRFSFCFGFPSFFCSSCELLRMTDKTSKHMLTPVSDGKRNKNKSSSNYVNTWQNEKRTRKNKYVRRGSSSTPSEILEVRLGENKNKTCRTICATPLRQSDRATNTTAV